MTLCTCGDVASSRLRKAQDGLPLASCLLFMVLRVAPGAEKTAAEKHFVLVLRFCNHVTIRGPDRFTERRGGGGGEGMLFHTAHKSMATIEVMWALWQCVRLPPFLLPLHPPQPTAESGQESTIFGFFFAGGGGPLSCQGLRQCLGPPCSVTASSRIPVFWMVFRFDRLLYCVESCIC